MCLGQKVDVFTRFCGIKTWQFMNSPLFLTNQHLSVSWIMLNIATQGATGFMNINTEIKHRSMDI